MKRLRNAGNRVGGGTGWRQSPSASPAFRKGCMRTTLLNFVRVRNVELHAGVQL
jgi:hypothetical protein